MAPAFWVKISFVIISPNWAIGDSEKIDYTLFILTDEYEFPNKIGDS